MFWGKMSEAEKFLRDNRFTKTTKGLNIALMEYAVSEKDVKKALEIEKQETAEKIFEEFDVWFKKWKSNFGYLNLDHKSYEKIKAKFLQERKYNE